MRVMRRERDDEKTVVMKCGWKKMEILRSGTTGISVGGDLKGRRRGRRREREMRHASSKWFELVAAAVCLMAFRSYARVISITRGREKD